MNLANELRTRFLSIKEIHANLCPPSLRFIQDHTIHIVDQLGSVIPIPTLFCSSPQVRVFPTSPLFTLCITQTRLYTSSSVVIVEIASENVSSEEAIISSFGQEMVEPLVLQNFLQSSSQTNCSKSVSLSGRG
jgi:hypothetical protein